LSVITPSLLQTNPNIKVITPPPINRVVIQSGIPDSRSLIATKIHY